jgi:nucleotide-binding universal stress UspA family protein
VTQGIKKIVVGVDGSASSRQALRWAEQLAGTEGATVDVVAAWGHPANVEWTVRTTNYGLVPLPEQPTRDDVRAAAEQSIDDMIGELGATDVTVTRHAVEGQPSNVLVDATGDADLLVLGRRGHSTVVDVLLGSVTHHCIQHAHCPVVVVPPQD